MNKDYIFLFYLKSGNLKVKQKVQSLINSYLNKNKKRYKEVIDNIIEDGCYNYIENKSDEDFYILYTGLKEIKERLLYADYTPVCSKGIEEAIKFLNIENIDFKIKKIITKGKNVWKSVFDRLKKDISNGKNKIVKFYIKNKKIASFSGGKDSAFMVIECLKKGIEFDHIIFADTTLEFPEMYEYIDKFEKYIGKEIIRLKPKYTFEELFFKEFCRGKYQGNIHGLPFVIGQGCYIKRDMKLRQIKDFKKSLTGDYIDYIGIAYDEPERYKRMTHGEQFAPLYEWQITENDCLEGLKKIDMYNPLYDRFKRLGCWLCPKQGNDSLYSLFKHYPDLWEKLKWYESKDFKPFKPNKSIFDIEEKFLSLE